MTDTRIVYVVEGEPFVGTVGDYAKALEQATYSDITVERTVWVFRGGEAAVAVTPSVSVSPYNEDDYATMTVSIEVDGSIEMASVRLDGRV